MRKPTISENVAESILCKNTKMRRSSKTKIGQNISNYKRPYAGSQHYSSSLSFDNYFVKLVSS